MPIEFFNRLKAMRKYSIIYIFAVILIPALLYLLITSVVYMKFLAAFIISLCILLLILNLCIAKNEIKNNAGDLKPYVIKHDGISEEYIINFFSAVEVTQDAFAAFLDYRKLSFRFLLVKNDIYDKNSSDSKKRNANRAINKKYGVSERHSVYTLKNVRVNVHIFYECSEDITLYLQRNAVQLLRRVEPIVNVFIDLKNDHIIIPAVCDALFWREVKAYSYTVNIILEKIGVNKLSY